jgi:hypothetical protein
MQALSDSGCSEISRIFMKSFSQKLSFLKYHWYNLIEASAIVIINNTRMPEKGPNKLDFLF